MSDVKVGELLNGTEERDAIHMAIAPVVAGVDLLPGEHVGLLDVVARTIGLVTGQPIGIVDPFLKRCVLKGERVWLFLYPLTVTGMRHHWTHPAFVDEGPELRHETAESRLRAYADKAGLSYGALLDAFEDRALGERGHYGARLPSDIPNELYDDIEARWADYETVTGKTVPQDQKQYAPFWCSC